MFMIVLLLDDVNVLWAIYLMWS